MTAAEMAKIIEDEHDPDVEDVQAFVLRRFKDEKLSTLQTALEILVELTVADELAEGQSPCRH